jgi:hypothetical protein
MLFLHLSHEHKPTRDPGSLTRDPAMNSVTASATFDVGRFLADNVGVAPTRRDMSQTFPTKKSSLKHVHFLIIDNGTAKKFMMVLRLIVLLL